VFETLGKDFTLLAFDADDTTAAAFARSAEVQRVPLKIVRDTYADGRKAYEAKLILVRPDRYIAWASHEPADAAAILAKAAGRKS
jgi:4-hydroxyisophthalate hydroxylase